VSIFSSFFSFLFHSLSEFNHIYISAFNTNIRTDLLTTLIGYCLWLLYCVPLEDTGGRYTVNGRRNGKKKVVMLRR
jgi:hypothetical protein